MLQTEGAGAWLKPKRYVTQYEPDLIPKLHLLGRYIFVYSSCVLLLTISPHLAASANAPNMH